MSDLVRIQTNDNMEQVVSARELHEKLGIKERFSVWFERIQKTLNMNEGIDYCRHTYTNTNNQTFPDYLIPIDIAKHICMVSGGERAHIIRQYFIEVEKAWNSPEMVMARSLEYAAKQLSEYKAKLEHAELVIEQQKPKVLFAESVTASSTSILVADLAKILKKNGIDIGEIRLWEWLRQNKYVISEKGRSRNMPTQRSMNLGIMEVKEGTYVNSKGESKITKTTLITGKGQVYFINKFLKAKEESLCLSK